MRQPYKALSTTGLLLSMLLSQAQVWAQGPPAVVNPQPALDAGELAPGLPVEREIAGGELHSYRLRLTEGQYLHALVKGEEIAVSVRLSEPGGELLCERSRNHKLKAEVILALARQSGEYRLTVSAPEQKGLRGRYTIRVEELRSSQPEDQHRVAAERAFAEGERLLNGATTAQSYRAALEKFEAALADRQAIGDRQGEAESLAFIGVAYRRLGDYRKALEYYQRALPLFRAVGDRLGEGETLNSMGAAHISKAEFQEALNVLNQALPLQREVGDRQGEISTLHNIGSVYLARGEALQSLEYFQQTLPLRRALRDVAGEARTLNSMGIAYAELSDPQKALESQLQALPLRREAGDRSGEANTIGNIGLTYLDLGEPEKALDYNERALSLRQAMGVPRDVAISNRNMSLTYLALGDGQRALDYGERALAVFREIGHRQVEASMLNQLGLIHDKLGDHQKALEYYSQALPLHRTTSDRRGEALALDGLGRSYAALKEWEKAREHLRRALELYGAIKFSTGEAQALLGLARVERETGDLGAARRRIEAALEVIESVRARIAVGQLRASYLATTQEFYEFHIDILMALHRRQPSQGFDAEALRASERARARSLLDSLVEARANIRQGVDSSLLEREHNLRQQLNAKEAHRLRLLEDKQAEERVSAAERDLQDLITQLQNLQAQILVQSPRYAALTQPTPIKVEEIQQQVLDDETLLLEYALGQERSFLWAVTRSSTSSFLLPGREKIEQTARRAYELMRVSHRRQNRREAELAAEELSRMLLGPVADRLGKQRLLVVADGMLQYIPFAALPIPARPGERPAATSAPRVGTHTYVPLVVEHEVVNAPSASALAVLRRELAHRKPAPKMVAVLADPVLQSGDGRVARNRPGSGREGDGPAPASRPQTGAAEEMVRSARETGVLSFERLPFSRLEAEAILALTRSTGNFKALDFDANRTTATSPALADYRIVHFATHGLINSQHPELSGVVLSLVDEQGRPQDGFLRLHDIYNLKLGADLVVLSACQTALGKQIKGEGLVGMVQGFTYAGAAQVVASLWDVKDEATAELMKRFYQKMIVEKQKPGAALREAQILMWKEERWREPYYWAGFTLQGEWK